MITYFIIDVEKIERIQGAECFMKISVLLKEDKARGRPLRNRKVIFRIDGVNDDVDPPRETNDQGMAEAEIDFASTASRVNIKILDIQNNQWSPPVSKELPKLEKKPEEKREPKIDITGPCDANEDFIIAISTGGKKECCVVLSTTMLNITPLLPAAQMKAETYFRLETDNDGNLEFRAQITDTKILKAIIRLKIGDRETQKRMLVK